ncbi:MAG: PASTA domain-containing protein [Bacteroidetes bacterium]|nr:MAG: PASTA domain-containing protein [Bacteroidota bacterium]
MSKIKQFFIAVGKFFISKTFLKHFGIAILLVGLLIWGAFKFLDVYTRHNETVDVPNFLDQKIGALDGFVSGKDVLYEVVDSIYDPKKPKGIVVSQDPEAGTKVKEGRTVYLFVTSTVPPKIAMPKLEDMSARQAMAVAESYGLIPKIIVKKADCNGCVVEQRMNGKRIEPGTLIEKGVKIDIIVGKNENNGGGDISVPNLVGLNFKQARSRLSDLGLDLTAIPDVADKKFDTLSSVVYRQSPPPHSERLLSPGSTVDIFLTHDKNKLRAPGDTTGPGTGENP